MYAAATHDTILSSHLKRFYPFHPRAFGRVCRKPERVKPKPKSRKGPITWRDTSRVMP